MEHLFYVARSLEFVPLAALGIALGPGRGDIATCRCAAAPAVPAIEAVPARAGRAAGRGRAAVPTCHRTGRLRGACRRAPIVGADFEPAPWSTLQRWVFAGNVNREALAAVAEHLGNAEDFAWLDRPAAPQ